MKRFVFEEDIFFPEEIEEVTPLLSTVSAFSPFFFAVKTKRKTHYYFYQTEKEAQKAYAEFQRLRRAS